MSCIDIPIFLSDTMGMGFELPGPLSEATRATKERIKDMYSFLKEAGERKTLAAEQLMEAHPKAVKGLKISAGVLGAILFVSTWLTTKTFDLLMRALSSNKELGGMTKDYFTLSSKIEGWMDPRKKKKERSND